MACSNGCLSPAVAVRPQWRHLTTSINGRDVVAIATCGDQHQFVAGRERDGSRGGLWISVRSAQERKRLALGLLRNGSAHPEIFAIHRNAAVVPEAHLKLVHLTVDESWHGQRAVKRFQSLLRHRPSLTARRRLTALA